jgi:transcriptional regulator with XRE-family HTH domain
LADACGVSRSTVVRWENDQAPVPKSTVMVIFLANVISDSGDGSLQMMTWPERERDHLRRYLSTKKHPVDIVAFAELRWFLDVPNPVVPTKEEMERKYKRQARYEKEKERRCL